MEYTTNFVGSTNDRNPNLIFMNDFVIQFFEYNDNIRFLDFYGLNLADNFKKFLNSNENEFIIKVIHNKERKRILNNLIREEKVKSTIDYFLKYFRGQWIDNFNDLPSDKTIKEYLDEIVGNNEFNILQYTEESIKDSTKKFINGRKNNNR